MDGSRSSSSTLFHCSRVWIHHSWFHFHVLCHRCDSRMTTLCSVSPNDCTIDTSKEWTKKKERKKEKKTTEKNYKFVERPKKKNDSRSNDGKMVYIQMKNYTASKVSIIFFFFPPLFITDIKKRRVIQLHRSDDR